MPGAADCLSVGMAVALVSGPHDIVQSFLVVGIPENPSRRGCGLAAEGHACDAKQLLILLTPGCFPGAWRRYEKREGITSVPHSFYF